MKTMTYKVSDLKALIAESSNEFKAKLGPGVESGDKANNGKAYKDAEKRAKDYDGGLADSVEVAKYDKTKEGDDNRTTLDYEVDNVDQKYKDRIKAQAEGYTSVAEKENGIEKQGDFEGNKNIFKGITDNADAWKEKMVNARASGLAARTYDKEKTFKHGDLYESNDSFEMRQTMNNFRNKLNGVINESNNSVFYSEEDSEGKTGRPGMVKSYDIGMDYVSNLENEAEEEGMSLEDYLKTWWNEVSGDIPFTWQETKGGYGHNGKTILKLGDVVFKDIFGQLIVDEYEPGRTEYEDDFNSRVKNAQMSSVSPDKLMENKNVKTAYFKKTTFLTEGHMMSRIPDEFKVEKNVFKMKDKTGNEYLLEWKNGKAEIISHSNKQGMNESIERMKALYGYKASDYYKSTTTASRLSESNEGFTDTLGKARKIIK